MNHHTIDILLATYNGAKFLEEQLESIVQQTHTNWQLLISDDGSVDGTPELIDRFIQKYPSKARLIQQENKGNASDNFLGLLEHAQSNYISFCDQDDKWEPTKLEKSLALLHEIEQSNPIALVFTDMFVVDQNLQMIDDSFTKRQRLDPQWKNEKYKVFAQSMAAGCTQLFTKALADKLHAINSTIFQHDHWLMIHAAQYGKIGYLEDKTVHYRQHDFNAVGADQLNAAYYMGKAATVAQLWQRWNWIKRVFDKEIKRRKIAKEKLKLSIKRVING